MTPSSPRPYSMWCFGLSEPDIACIRQCAGDECLVTAQDEAVLADEPTLIREEPTLFWVQADIWERLGMGRLGGSAGSVPKVMVLGEACGASDLDRFIAADAEHVLRGPLTKDGVYKILRRTLEVCTIHADMGRMTREILLNRELLGRKSDALQFLFEAEEKLGPAKDISDLLLGARDVLSKILPVRSLHAALWQREHGSNVIDLYFEGLMPDSPAGRVWQHMLLDAAGRMVSGESSVRRMERLRPGAALTPDKGCVLLLPLTIKSIPIGALMLLQAREMTCSRDQSLAINAVLARLACLIRLSGLPVLLPARAERIRADQSAR